jgi:hypothetical protein
MFDCQVCTSCSIDHANITALQVSHKAHTPLSSTFAELVSIVVRLRPGHESFLSAPHMAGEHYQQQQQQHQHQQRHQGY